MNEVKRGSKLVNILDFLRSQKALSTNFVLEAIFNWLLISFFCIRIVKIVRERAPLLVVKSDAARGPTTTPVLLKRELRLLKIQKRGIMGKSNTSVYLYV